MKIFDYFDRIVILNLPSRPDRLKLITRELEKIGSSFSEKVLLFPAIRPKNAGGFPSIGAKGCFLTHLAIIEKAKQDNIERLLIIEDDLLFYPEFTKLEQKIVTLLQQKPWGMVYLGHFIPPKALSDNLLQEYLDPILCSHLVGFHQSTFNELISHLKAILKREAGDPAGGPMHIDGAYNHFREKNREFKTLVANPSLGTQRSSRSDVAPLRWFDRIPILNSFFNFLRSFKNK